MTFNVRDYASRNGHPPRDRYAGRVIDLGALLAQPPRPVPWRVWDLVADGTVTILSGESTAGKSWLAQALCLGVARGEPAGGLACTLGHALYIDAEMGPQMFVDQRLRPALVTEAEFDYIDAMGLDVSTDADLAWLRMQVEDVEADLVVIDSLRRLTPSQSENDSDDMAPTVAAVGKLARDTGAAIVLIHHKGEGEKFYRGSTAIRDQADALFVLLREGEDEENPVRRLRCRGGRGKMRYAPEPPDAYLAIAPHAGGVAATDEPEQAPGGSSRTVQAQVRQQILDVLPATSKTAVAVLVGRKRDDHTFRDAWAILENDGAIVRHGGQWVAVVPEGGGRAIPDPREPDGPPAPDPTLFDERAEPGNVICDRCGGTTGIPIDPHTGEPIRSREFEAPGTPVTWPMAILCARCVHELRGEA